VEYKLLRDPYADETEVPSRVFVWARKIEEAATVWEGAVILSVLEGRFQVLEMIDPSEVRADSPRVAGLCPTDVAEQIADRVRRLEP